MLKNDLYFLEKSDVNIEEGTASLIVKLNAEHDIFLGHFPGSPVLPGVCIVQIIKEMLSEIIKNDLMLVKSNSIKFLNLISPLHNLIINFDFKFKNIENNNVQLSCMVFYEDIKFCNFKGEFKIVNAKAGTQI